MRNISLNIQPNGDFVSVPFTTLKTAFRFRVEYKNAGRGNKVFLETKVYENSPEWVFVGAPATYSNESRIIEETVGGVIPGQLFRIITAGPSRVMVID